MQANTVKCTACKMWIRKRCNGVRGELSRVIDGVGCKHYDSTAHEADPAEELVIDGDGRTDLAANGLRHDRSYFDVRYSLSKHYAVQDSQISAYSVNNTMYVLILKRQTVCNKFQMC